ncbi:MAG: ATP-binding cassette domain-containing protein [Flavobacteriales bacterium]|nr:ATP-binding cassette domain-containing protein [Flavobacteriales bacterium]NCG29834.1 ATP-binding cassette domain-containing protein [Bacteroidota bacterium]MBT3963189.1 ATP-binding cassette domain-containing protein [Flavobacteriales bacterium]MBT4705725.1 ATP-binding cassette domain-containing protein [Flavobacteriales bacterium]MBT4931001.1 ATP-binding cassette domain-containing protein [Flavobacteriales bacterium]
MVEKERKRGISKESFRRALRIFRYVWPHRLKFCIGVVFLFLSAFTFMTFPGLLGRLIGGDEVSDSPIDQFFSLENVNQIALLLLAAFALQALFSFLRIYLFADVTERAIAKIRQDVYQHIIQLPMTFFNRERVGELNSRISNDISQLQETFMTTLAELIRQAVIIIFGVTLLFFYSIELTFVMLVSLPVMMLAAFFFGKFIRRLSKATQDELARSQVVVEETLQGIQSVKAYVNEPHEISRYFNVTENVRTVAMKAAKWRGAFASFIIFGLFGAIVLVIWYGVKLKNAGEIGLDELTSFILYSVFVGGSIGGVADIFGKVQKAIGSTENLFDLMEEEKEKLEHDSAIPSVSTKNKLKGKIQFDHVQFAYATRADKTVLDDVSFKIEAGERVAIVGSSGSGKSTIASLLYRFYDPNSGSILFDDQDSRSMDLKSLRDNLALVPQEVLLFGGSIRENIAYGKTTATEEEIFEAAAKANALEFIESFPDKFETLVGERGVQLSGGQRQRVAIARAILKDPSILILDEATSALDSESELLVQDALDRLMEGRTSIIIAHRLSTVRKASNILVIDRGEVSESGTHSELIKIENGLYRKLSEMQVLA